MAATNFKNLDYKALVFENYGLRLSETERKWFAIDGKELRGSIAKGLKRGEAIVQAVGHENLQVAGQDYYSGEKESARSDSAETIRGI